eukprot:15433825-Alexandrium_andersonii.AAC.1
METRLGKANSQQGCCTCMGARWTLAGLDKDACRDLGQGPRQSYRALHVDKRQASYKGPYLHPKRGQRSDWH